MKEIEIWDNSGNVTIPGDYEWFASGDHFLTRKVKSLCKQFNSTIYIEKSKSRHYWRTVGYYATQAIVNEARKAKEETRKERAAMRQKSAVYRQKKEKRYEDQFAEKVKQIFPGIPEGDAESIARRACEVGSDRVGRTRQIHLDEKVELAVNAHARHSYTEYEQSLCDVSDEYDYRELRQSIGAAVMEIVDGWREELPCQAGEETAH